MDTGSSISPRGVVTGMSRVPMMGIYEVEELETAAERYLHVRPQALPGEDAPTYHARLLQVKPPHQPCL